MLEWIIYHRSLPRYLAMLHIVDNRRATGFDSRFPFCIFIIKVLFHTKLNVARSGLNHAQNTSEPQQFTYLIHHLKNWGQPVPRIFSILIVLWRWWSLLVTINTCHVATTDSTCNCLIPLSFSPPRRLAFVFTFFFGLSCLLILVGIGMMKMMISLFNYCLI